MKKAVMFLLVLSCFAATATAQEPPTLTVLDFEVNNISVKDMKSIISFLSASLFDTGFYRVIDTAQRETILQELEFSSTGCTDESCQLEIGRLLSAEIIVVGDIAKVGNRYMFTARMVQTETSETISTSKAIYQSIDDLIDGTSAFAVQLTSAGALPSQVEPDVIAEEPAAEVDETTVMKPETTGEESVPDETEVTADEPVEDDVVTDSEVSGSTQKTGPDMKKILSWSTLGLGVAASGAGAYFLADALEYKHQTVDPALAAYNDTTVTDFGGSTPEEYFNSLYAAYTTSFSSFKTKALTGLLVTGGGILSLGCSALFFLLPDKPKADVSFLVLPAPEACSFRCSIRL